MNRDNERQSAIILSVIGIIPVVWLALLIAPSVKGGLPEILPSLLTAFNEPFHIELCEDSLKTVLVLLLCYYGMGLFFAKTVAEKYGGGIKLSNSENTGGARVEIFFLSSQETS